MTTGLGGLHAAPSPPSPHSSTFCRPPLLLAPPSSLQGPDAHTATLRVSLCLCLCYCNCSSGQLLHRRAKTLRRLRAIRERESADCFPSVCSAVVGPGHRGGGQRGGTGGLRDVTAVDVNSHPLLIYVRLNCLPEMLHCTIVYLF